MKKIIFIAAIVLTSFQNLAYAQSAKINELDSVILKILKEQEVPGASVALVTKDSIIWLGNLGQADVENNAPVIPHTLFGIGSISKTFLSLAAMIAQDKGMLNINQPIKQLIPSLDFDNRWEDTHPVRLIHLLEHTSGFDEGHFSLFSQANSKTPFSEVMEKSKQSLVTRWKPGSYFAYNNLGAIVAAYGIETATDQPYEDFVRENIFIPLTMNQANYHVSNENASFVSKGYNSGPVEEPHPDLPQWPAGGIIASTEDMAALVKLFLNEGEVDDQQIVSPASVRKMETPETSLLARAEVQYGYGKGLRGKIEKGYLFYGHDGSYGGFQSEFGYSRELGIGYVILINNRDKPAARKAIKETLLSSIIPEEPGLVPKNNDQPTPPASLEGCYQPITFAMDVTAFAMRLVDLQFIEQEEGRWYRKGIFGGRQEILPVSDTQFRKPHEPLATSVFVKSSTGEWQWLNKVAYQQIPIWWGYFQFFTIALCLLIVVVSFLVTILRFIARAIRKRKTDYQPQLLLPLAFGSLISMVFSIAILYDPFEKYSTGAILFLMFGWAFLLLSYGSLFQAISIVYRKSTILPSRYYNIFSSLAYSVIATYLLYWDIIGLTLWNY